MLNDIPCSFNTFAEWGGCVYIKIKQHGRNMIATKTLLRELMVLIFDGSSEYGAHIGVKMYYLFKESAYIVSSHNFYFQF